MVSRAAQYILPIGATVLALPNVVFAAGQKCSPASVYEEPKQEPCGCPKEECDGSDTQLERFVMECRQKIEPFKDTIDTYLSNTTGDIKGLYDSTNANICYLRTRAPNEIRIGTVVAGGLVGMMFGIRRGFTRKLLFGGLGAAGASYLVYPDETVYYSRNGFSIARKYFAVAQNFVLGENSEGAKVCRSDAPVAKLKAEKAACNIKCSGYNGPPKKASSGFFSMFSSSSSSSASSSCNCNGDLQDHLKKCAGLGNLPPLLEKCEDIPGAKDRYPRSTCQEKENKDKKSDCFACGSSASKCDEPKKFDKKCPPMPVSDCSNCKPAWISCPPTLSKTYPVPEGVEILPISIGGRNGRPRDSCGKCGEVKKGGKPKVNGNCPMMKPRCPGLQQEEAAPGFLSKLTSMFGMGKK